jgi:predicted acylesterase/phospholipase RssA
MTLKILLVKEIKALLEEGGGSIAQLLLKASRLAKLCGDVWHEELFKLHVEGLDVDESGPTLTIPPDLAPDVTEVFYQDRMLSTGRPDSRPLKQLELWRRDLPAFAVRINAEEHSALAAEIPQLMSELTAMLGKIKDRVAEFVERIEVGATADLPDSQAEDASAPVRSPIGGDAGVGPFQSVGAVHSHPTKPTLTLIMKGGGIKGLAYVGALKELTRYYNFDWYVGTSAGAIVAALLASGVDIKGLEKILKETNFKEVLLDSPKRWLLYNLIAKGGLYPGVRFQAWIGNIINRTLDSPVPVHLNNLPKSPSILKHRLTVYASTDHKRTLVFDSTSETSSGARVNFAVFCSMSIPFLFISETNAGARTIDGGVHNNYPVAALLDDNPKVDFIGLYLGPEVYEEEERRPLPLLSAIRDFFSTLLNAADMETLREHRERTIVIDPRPVSTIDFNLSDEEKDFLLKAGKASALKFLRGRSLPNGPTAEEVNTANEEARLARETVIALRAERGKHWRLVRTNWALLLILLFIFLLGTAVGMVWLLW